MTSEVIGPESRHLFTYSYYIRTEERNNVLNLQVIYSMSEVYRTNSCIPEATFLDVSMSILFHIGKFP